MKQEILNKVLSSQKNLIIEGDVSSGKTTNVSFPIVDEIIKNKESLFIIDTKEEYVNQYYRALKENNYNTIIINLRDLNKSDGWNPLEYPYNLYQSGDIDKALEYLEKIGKTIFYEDSTADPFWSITATDFFTGVTLGLFEDAKKEEINFSSINYMFDGIDKKYGSTDYITTYFKSKDVTSKPYIFASSTFLAPKDTKGSILSVARQKLRLLVSREKLSYLLNKTTFSFEDVISKPTAIIFIARDENKSFNLLVPMFIEQLYSILLEKNTNNKFNFILDNFDIIEKCNDLVDILSSCTSRNIKINIITRSLEKLSGEYGDYMIKLCNVINVRENDIRTIINREEELTDKNFETIVISKENVEYPKLNEESLKLFDLEKKVKNYHGEKMLEEAGKSIKPVTTESIDELIKHIDDKIAQIELEQQMDLSKDNKVKSELEQFKIKES